MWTQVDIFIYFRVRGGKDMKDKKRFAALALSAIMVVSMAGNVYASKEVASKDDLAGATIGVQLGTTGDLDASDYEKDGSTVERYNKGSEAVQALKAGQIDCVIHSRQRNLLRITTTLRSWMSHSKKKSMQSA